MTEIRCKKCNRLLMKGLGPMDVEVKCSKCGYINHITVSFITAVGKWSNGMPEKYATGEKVVEVA